MSTWLGSLIRTRPSALDVEWIDDWRFRIGRTEFVMATDLEGLHRLQTSNERFLLGKNRGLVEDIVRLRDAHHIKNIVDIGIFKGGSVALYALLFEPKKLVGIEYSPGRVEPLDTFIADRNLRDSVATYYSTNQNDSARLRDIVRDEFSGEDLDLVVDDASHHYPETRASFQTLLPALRPGGVYIIEDWGWAHWSGDVWQKCQAFPADAPSLTNLMIEVSVLCASRPDIVAAVEVQPSLIRVRRGPARLAMGELNLDQECLNRGKPLPLLM